MKTSLSIKYYFHLIGSGLTVIGIVFVVFRLYIYGGKIDFTHFNSLTWTGVAILTLIYSLANLMLALAWWDLLAQCGVQTSRWWAIKTYSSTQLAKYVPGNIFHLAGRHAMGFAAGIPGWSLAKSVVGELILISIAGIMFGILALPRLMPLLSVPLATLIFACTGSIIAFSVWKYWGTLPARAFGWYSGFLATSGMLFVGVICLLDNNFGNLPWVEIFAAYILAWLTGLVTPGAPAGVGVRELMLLFLLNGLVSEVNLLLAVVLGRIITVTGDLVFFGFGSLMGENVSNL